MYVYPSMLWFPRFVLIKPWNLIDTSKQVIGIRKMINNQQVFLCYKIILFTNGHLIWLIRFSYIWSDKVDCEIEVHKHRKAITQTSLNWCYIILSDNKIYLFIYILVSDIIIMEQIVGTKWMNGFCPWYVLIYHFYIRLPFAYRKICLRSPCVHLLQFWDPWSASFALIVHQALTVRLQPFIVH